MYTNFPIEGISKRRPYVSISTPEAELVACNFAMRTSGLPSMAIWKKILSEDTVLRVHEDNHAMIRVIHTGKNPAMRYLERVHRMNVRWIDT